jgi:hypothetical protein
MPKTVRYTRIPASHASRIPIAKRWACGHGAFLRSRAAKAVHSPPDYTRGPAFVPWSPAADGHAPAQFEIVPRAASRVPAWALARGRPGAGAGAGRRTGLVAACPGGRLARSAHGRSDRRLGPSNRSSANSSSASPRWAAPTRSAATPTATSRTTLADKDEQIASLRADVAFYERFVGSGGERKGLSVHSAEFEREAGGSWRYQVVLTQSLNRGA